MPSWKSKPEEKKPSGTQSNYSTPNYPNTPKQAFLSHLLLCKINGNKEPGSTTVITFNTPLTTLHGNESHLGTSSGNSVGEQIAEHPEHSVNEQSQM